MNAHLAEAKRLQDRILNKTQATTEDIRSDLDVAHDLLDSIANHTTLLSARTSLLEQVLKDLVGSDVVRGAAELSAPAQLEAALAVLEDRH